MTGSENKWDEIPSLNLEMDGDYEARLKAKQGRRHERSDAASLKNILPGNPARLPIRIGTAAKGVFDGLLIDLSASGLRIRIPKALNMGEAVKVGFILNKRTILAKATTRWVAVKERYCDVGLQFKDLAGDDADFIAQLTSASILSKVGKIK